MLGKRLQKERNSN